MDPRERIVVSLPLAELFDERGPLAARRLTELLPGEVRDLLRLGPVRFVVVAVGMPPRWIPSEECFHFWKSEVAENVVASGPVEPWALPRGYCYFASRWGPETGAPIVLLEMLH